MYVCDYFNTFANGVYNFLEYWIFWWNDIEKYMPRFYTCNKLLKYIQFNSIFCVFIDNRGQHSKDAAIFIVIVINLQQKS